ncbi:MAG: malic enzyme-like NAD(P)-binding protein [bacterium]
MNYEDKALRYHSEPLPGKISISITKRCETADDLSMAYTPGVAGPCRAIEKNPLMAGKYTVRDNLVGVITNGTAVLGLGNIGPLASKPVMEGKSVLFKKFAGIDVFDLEIDESEPDRFISIVKSMEPTFGGINLEDIRAPECFYIEEQLKEKMDIPVFHDDQHGTAVIATAGLINALEITGKDPACIRMIVSGAGAAALSCIDMFMKQGIRRENIFVFDSNGMLSKERDYINDYKKQFAFHEKSRTMDSITQNADLFLGLSVKGVLKPGMLKSMNRDPIVFALANPDPEIDYHTACQVRDDVIMATGRSDYPNQINNVLGFPFIFRGALDCGAVSITQSMKLAAAESLASIARERTPDSVKSIYGKDLQFGRHYFIPKPFDRRVFVEESTAVLKAALNEKVNRKQIDPVKYRNKLEEMI